MELMIKYVVAVEELFWAIGFLVVKGCIVVVGMSSAYKAVTNEDNDYVRIIPQACQLVLRPAFHRVLSLTIVPQCPNEILL